MTSVDNTLSEGAYVRGLDGCVYYVDCVTQSGAHLIPLTGRPGLIRDRQKRIKEIFRHSRRHIVVAANAAFEKVDPAKLDTRLMQRRIKMAKIEGAANETAEVAAADSGKGSAEARLTQKYKLTNKAPKESMKGQGRLVYDTLKGMGGEATVGDLTKAVVATNQLATRQEPERVVGFYCSKFKRDGLVEAVRPAVAAEQAAAAAV